MYIDFENVNKQKGKPFRVMPALSTSIIRIPLMKVLVSVCTISHIFLTSLNTVYFFTNFSLKYFIKYAAMYFGFMYCIVVMSLSIFYMDEFIKLMDLMSDVSRSYQYLDEKSRKRMKYLELVSNVGVICIFLMSLIVCYFFLPISGASRDMYFVVWFVQTYFPFPEIFEFLYFCTFLGLFYIPLAQLFPVFYLCLQSIFQMSNLRNFIANISFDYSKTDINLYYDEEYQRQMKKRLKFCIQYHKELKSVLDNFQGIVCYPLIIQFIFATILGVSILFYIYTGMTPDTYPRMVCLSTLAIVTVVIVSIVGQKFTDMSETIFDTAVMCPWYLWNQSNKKTLQIFLMNCVTPHSLAMSETVSLDYTFMIKVASNLYSMATAIRGFAHVHNK